MTKLFSLFPVNLQMFTEGGAPANVGTAGNGATGETATAAVSQVGVQPSPQANVGKGNDDLTARFDELIKGEFKEVYDKKVSDTFKKRMKNSKETVDKFEKLQPALAMIAKGYGVDATDVDAIVDAVKNDDRYYEEEALKQGVDVGFYKRLKNAEDIAQKAQAEEQMRQDIARWHSDFETNVKQVFPNISFEDAMNNPKFVTFMQMGIDALSAVTALNARESFPAAMEAAAKSARKKVTDDIMANQRRPVEGAAMSAVGISPKIDVSKMTNADVERYLERVRGGEKGIDLKTVF